MSQPIRYRFGEFEFHCETGELRPSAKTSTSVAEAQPNSSRALPPQPARLLQLLLEKGGELLTREEIRQSLWPETHVDFDSSLHFCIRQIRSALGDDANTEGYIETLPRRGYRLSVPVEVVTAQDSAAPLNETAGPSPGPHKRRSGDIQLLIWVLSVPLGLLGAGLLALMVTKGRLDHLDQREHSTSAVTAAVEPVTTTGPLRLAILPFEVGIDNETIATRSARLSEGLTAALTQSFNDPQAHTRDRVVRILGPLSTAPYRELPFPQLDDLRADLGIDLVLNARIVEGGTETEPGVEGVLVELIDTRTRAHLWADFYPLTTDWLLIEAPIVDAVKRAIATWSEAG
jgi:DNA-binding winged helix-turn-helix (wHTH) protein/TolB-like protein